MPTPAARQPQKSRGKGGFSPQGLRCHGSAALRPLKRPHPCFFAAEEYLSFLRSLWAFCAWLAYPFRFICRGGVLCDVTGTVTRHMAAVVGRLGFCPLALSVRSYVSPSFNALAPASRRPLYALMLLLLVPTVDTMRHFAPAFIVLRSRRGLPAARLVVFTVGSVARARAFITSAILPPLPAPLFRRLKPPGGVRVGARSRGYSPSISPLRFARPPPAFGRVRLRGQRSPYGRSFLSAVAVPAFWQQSAFQIKRFIGAVARKPLII